MSVTAAHDVALIPLHRGGEIVAYALVDADQGDALSRHHWLLSTQGYAVRSAGKRDTVRMHREILGLSSGGADVDHINRCRTDNRRANLRVASRLDNLRNSVRYELGGVRWHPAAGKWRARMKVDGRDVHIGVFTSEREARRALDEARRAAGREPFNVAVG